MRRKVFFRLWAFLVFLALAGPGLPLPVSAVQDATLNEPIPNLRTWKDRSGKHSIQAELVKYADSTVELKKADGTTISVPLKELSNSDKWFVRKEMKARKSRSTTAQPQNENVAKREQKEQAPRGKLSQKDQEHLQGQISTKRLFGLEWHQSPESLAAASKLTSSDKPIMWFRVLGDLEGFM